MYNEGFETERLWLKPSDTDDAAFFLELLNCETWIENIGDRNVHTLSEAENYILTKIKPQFEKLGYANYTMIRKNDLTKIGSCGLYAREGLEGIDIGYALLPKYERNGYAFEAASKLKNAAFSIFGLNNLKAFTTYTNIPSQRLLEKLGMQYVKDFMLAGDPEILRLYELRRENIIQ